MMKTETHTGGAAAPRRKESTGLKGGPIVCSLAEDLPEELARKHHPKLNKGVMS